jgi:membrane peptidoglycan carboxypeptidase
MTPPPKSSQRSKASRTLLGNLTQAFQTVQAKIDFSQFSLKPGARVAQLWVDTQEGSQSYPLLGDRYVVGRSSSNCDIVVRSPIVSQIHASVVRDRKRPETPFVIRDENSTNGLYRGRKRLSKATLNHGDVIALGPPELKDVVTLRYVNPPPLIVQGLRYALYGFTALSLMIGLWIVAVEWPRIPVRPLPESVQGPVIIYAQEADRQVPLRQSRRRAHVEMARLSDFSPFLPQAVIASEDARYYWHLGVDPLGILRALLTNLQGGGIREGGSTLTQQLARSIYREYVGTDDTAGRKLREAFAALKLETFLSKRFLLRTYLNRVFLGSDLYGFEDAAQFYFGKSASDLDLSEAATLAGILPAPNAFNPVTNYQAAVEYRDRVLNRMVSLGMVSAEEGRRARRSRIEISPDAREELQSTRAPYFFDYVFEELESVLGRDLAREGNFIVETGVDLQIQAQAEASLRQAIAGEGMALGYGQGAVVTVDINSGEVRALVGGIDYGASQFNRATQALRQPGSTFKLFAYAAALEQGISPATSYSCAPMTWMGQSFAGCRSGGGSQNMYTGMAQSENVVALRIAEEAGLNATIQTARRLGIDSELRAVPGLVLGESEVTPLELTGAFNAIANNGVWNRPHGIRRVLDSSACEDPQDANSCYVIYEFGQAGDSNQQGTSSQVASLLNDMLVGVVQSGTGRAAFLGRGEGGKTGTTNDNRDLWFVGSVPGAGLTTGIWLGNDDNAPTGGSSGDAARLWGSYMGRIVP